jgi:hypothetical protein
MVLYGVFLMVGMGLSNSELSNQSACGGFSVPVEAFMFQINKRLDARRGKSTI